MSTNFHESHGDGASHGPNATIHNYNHQIVKNGVSLGAIKAAITIPQELDNEKTRMLMKELFSGMVHGVESGCGEITDTLKHNDRKADGRHRSLLDRLLGSDAANPARRGRNYFMLFLFFWCGIGTLWFGTDMTYKGLDLAISGHDSYLTALADQRAFQKSLESQYPVKQKEGETREEFLHRCKTNVNGLEGQRLIVQSQWRTTTIGIKTACTGVALCLLAMVVCSLAIVYLGVLYFADMIWEPANADKIFPKTRAWVNGIGRKISERVARFRR